MMAQKNIGLFSGSFNPIHIGHLALANWLCEYDILDEIWFLISPHNPLKKRASLLADHLRLKMAEKALAGYARCKASDFEFHLPTPNYTIETLRALHATYPSYQFHLIMGEDNWEVIDQWRESETLIRDYPIIIYPRKGFEAPIPPGIHQTRKVNAPLIEISSTMIRQAIHDGKTLPFFLPETIREEVQQYYQHPSSANRT